MEETTKRRRPATKSAYDRMVDLLSRRDHSALELTAKLKKAGHTPDEVDEAIEIARIQNWMPDESVLADREAGRLARAGKSPTQIRAWLSRKGLPAERLGIEENETDSAYKTATKSWARLVRMAIRDVEKAESKRASGAGRNGWGGARGDFNVEASLKTRVLRLLISRGFSTSTAQKVFTRLLSENPL